METYDIALTSCMIGFIIGAILGIYVIYSSFNEVVIPSKLSELQSQFDLETQRTMPDEITLNNSTECIENKTIEYFAGFEYCKTEQICGFTFEELKTELSLRNIRLTYELILIRAPSGDIMNCIYNRYCNLPIQNRTYCTKAIEVIKK